MAHPAPAPTTTSSAPKASNIMSFLHPELSQGTPRFDRYGPGSFRCFRALFVRLWNTALVAAPVSRIGNDRAGSRGAQGSERVVFHVMQGQDGLDHGGAAFGVTAQ